MRDIESILADLVGQFSDPLAFFRELVQNSIDAGSGEIDVRVEFEEGDDEDDDDGASRAVITVQDWGEGMDREIIEGRFLRLFSSGKEDDYTKVGRFGIGFVSVFAVEPEKVVVDTGRHGEYWRVVFDEDRSWELYEREMPLEGTVVRIFKPMQRERFERFRRQARRALRRWCRHPEIPVLFEGQDVRSLFNVNSRLTVEHEQEGTRVIMGMTDEPGGAAGYYNRGLTLQETSNHPWPWVTFKIDSRYLEHTLTRDRLLDDENFTRAMELLGEMAERQLPKLLVDRIEEIALDGDELEEYDVCCRYLAHYLSCRAFHYDWWPRRLFRTAGGEALTFHQMRVHIEEGTLHLTRPPLPPEDAVGEGRHLIAGEGVCRLVARVFDRGPGYLEERYLVPRALKAAEPTASRRLKHALRHLLDVAGTMPDELIFASAVRLPQYLKDKMAVVVPSRFRGVVPATEAKVPGFDIASEQLGAGSTLIVNTGIESVRQLCRVARNEPEWAAFALMDALFGDSGSMYGAVAANRRGSRVGVQQR